MLDLENPQTENVFQASAHESRILKILVDAEKQGKESLDSREITEISVQINKLKSLNIECFKNNTDIAKSLATLEKKLTESQNVSTQCDYFLKFIDSGTENFGTWMI